MAKQANEINDLKNQNRAVMEENARLSEFTRMLLSSNAFSDFMNEISADSLPRATVPEAQPDPVRPNTRKDVNPNQVAQQQARNQQPHQRVGMAFMPDIDFSNIDLNNSWNAPFDQSYNPTPTVFAVTEISPGPAVDTGILSGKTSNSVPSFSSSDGMKEQIPCIERMPAADKPEETQETIASDDVELDESDPAFALFVDVPSSKPAAVEPLEAIFGGVPLEKAFSRVELVVYDGSADEDTAAMDRFERLCSSMEDAFQRIGSVTSHL